MNELRYRKPSMTNLPYELGKSIFEEILNSKPVDREKTDREVEEFMRKMIAEREKEDNER